MCVTYCLRFAALLFDVCWVLLLARCAFGVACVRCVVFLVRIFLSVACCPLCVVRRALVVVHCPLFVCCFINVGCSWCIVTFVVRCVAWLFFVVFWLCAVRCCVALSLLFVA